MHHRNIQAIGILGVDLARVGQAGLFIDRQCIELGADEDDWARAILQNADHSCAADVFGDFKPEFAQPSSHLGGGAGLMQR